MIFLVKLEALSPYLSKHKNKSFLTLDTKQMCPMVYAALIHIINNKVSIVERAVCDSLFKIKFHLEYEVKFI